MSRAAIQSEIDKVLARSATLTEQSKTRARGNIEKALSGSGFGDSERRAMAKTIAPANSGFRKGSVASQFQEIDPEVDQFHTSPASAADFASDPDGAVSHFNAPGGVHGGYDGSAATVQDSPLARAIRDQYPTIVGMAHLELPKPMTFEERYSRPATPHYEPTSGPPIIESPDKAQRMTLQKSAGATRLAKLERLESLVGLLAAYANGDDAAGVVLGIR